ncbi:MAG: 50S ribosomal protein L3 N(5)-glutamine methyltransferase [Opitutaceae bacterium]
MSPTRPLRRKRKSAPDPFAATGRLGTVGAWLAFAERLYRSRRLALGQIAADAHDEALYLILRALGLPLESGPEALRRAIVPGEGDLLRGIFRSRAIDRIPAAYLTREAWLGGRRFYVDERTIIPRSYFLEIIPGQLDPWLPNGAPVRRAADVCTGSGCLAILLAERFPEARIDAIDLSADALAVAGINVRGHRLGRRIELRRSDLFAGVPRAAYDLIVSNPPYEPSGRVDRLPPEFQKEPRLALDGGPDGLALVRRLLADAPARLTARGIVAIEVGGLRKEVDREFARFGPHWLRTADGSDCVVLFQAARLRT